MSTVRIAVVADIHHGEDSFTKKGTAALALMAEFARFTEETRPDLVVDLGDRISDVDHQTDLRLEREVAEVFKSVAGPIRHICGNHDRDHLTVEENAEILGQSLEHETIDLGDWTLVFWRADSRIRRPGGFCLTEADLLWLAGVVRSATRPLAIFSHVPISGHDQTGNYYFQRNPEASTYPGAERARAILATARVPVVCIAGHVHWNTLTTVDGISHLTLQSLTETFTTHPAPAGAYAMLELSDTSVDWRVHGLDPMACRLDTAALARRWIVPLPKFDEHPEIRDRHRAASAALAAE